MTIHFDMSQVQRGARLRRSPFSQLGTRLEVDTPAGMREATVVKKPFVDPTKEIPKS